MQVMFCLQGVESSGKIFKTVNFRAVPYAPDNEN
jgi:hypothetical protein